MGKRRAGDSKRIVVDASIARVAGGLKATDESAKACRDFLLAIYEVCHRAVMSEAIGKEWREHRSPFFRKWCRWMQGCKKLISPVTGEFPACIGEACQAVEPESRREMLLKDLHLIEAAFLSDRIIASRDDTARAGFAGLTEIRPELKPIIWVNPCEPGENCQVWLEDGAPAEEQRTLAAYASPL